MLVAVRNNEPALVKLLLDAGADKDAPDQSVRYPIDGERMNRATPIIYAANDGHLEIVKLLLDAGANKDAVDYWGNSALSAARHNHHSDVVKLLEKAGAK